MSPPTPGSSRAELASLDDASRIALTLTRGGGQGVSGEFGVAGRGGGEVSTPN